jgi:hypothetical protein
MTTGVERIARRVKGHAWTYVRGDRPYGGRAPLAALYYASRDRRHEHPVRHLRGICGTSPAFADAYDGLQRSLPALPLAGPITSAVCRVGGEVALLAPQRPGRAEYRIRLFTRKLHSRHGILVDDPGWWQRVSREQRPEARPRQIAVAATPREPFPPDPRDLVMVPSDPPAVSGDAVVGAVPPDYP